MKSIKGIILSLAVSGAIAHAQSSMSAPAAPTSAASSSSTSSSSIIDGIKQKKYEEDTRITDLQIRAEAGSLSRYSGKFSLGYSGPKITDFGDDEMPNPSGSTTDVRTYVSGILGIKYRLSSNDGLYVSAGIRSYFAPKTGDNQDLTDPGITYDHTFTYSDTVQARLWVLGNTVTNSFYRNLGEKNGLVVGQTVKWNVPETRWVAGLEASFNNYFFNRGYDRKDRAITDYYFNFIPSVEYKVSRNFNINTSSQKKIAHYRKETEATTFDMESYLWNSRLGVGWAVTRDIYLNPYLGFYPEELSPDNTSIGFNSTISVF